MASRSSGLLRTQCSGVEGTLLVESLKHWLPKDVKRGPWKPLVPEISGFVINYDSFF